MRLASEFELGTATNVHRILIVYAIEEIEAIAKSSGLPFRYSDDFDAWVVELINKELLKIKENLPVNEISYPEN